MAQEGYYAPPKWDVCLPADFLKRSLDGSLTNGDIIYLNRHLTHYKCSACYGQLSELNRAKSDSEPPWIVSQPSLFNRTTIRAYQWEN